MKKIIIAANSMNIGGTEKALIGMLKSINPNDYKVTLLLKDMNGELINEIPSYVDIREYPGNGINLKGLLKNMKLLSVIKYIYYAVLMKLTNDACKKYIYSNKIASKINEKYDIAISYYMPISTQVVYVLNNINSDYKYAWVHCDITRMGEEMHNFEHIYNQYDKVFCVSKELKDKCIEYFPSLKNKTEVIYNILDYESIEKKSNEYKAFKDDFDGIRICTVGRLSPEKQQDFIIPIVNKLKKEGYKINWYCIGDGKLRDKLESMITENNLEKEVILLGSKKNPYPYMKESDIYVQLSRHEGYCLTLAEARILNKPIVTTNFAGAKEQIEDGVTGLIVNSDIDEITNAIKSLIEDPIKKKYISDNLQKINKMNV